MKTWILLGLIAVAAAMPDLVSQEEKDIVESYLQYIKDFERHYDHDAMYYRYSIFRDNYKKIASHNSIDGSSYQLGFTNFTDWTWDEFRSQYLMNTPQDCSATSGNFNSKHDLSDLPERIDWRTKGILYDVKDQGSCGSCWTFSTTGSLEAHWSLKTGKPPVSLSEQQLVDCAQAFNNHGCRGGLPSQAFEYIRYVGGLDADDSYPYTAKDGTCKFKSVDVAAKVPGGSVNITQGDEQGIVEAVGTIGPVSIAFQVISDFQHYTGGVYSSDNCGTTSQDVNHAVVAVGYDATDDGTPYWIVRNSWGTGWGLDGYFYIARGENMCALAQCASYPDVNGKQSLYSLFEQTFLNHE